MGSAWEVAGCGHKTESQLAAHHWVTAATECNCETVTDEQLPLVAGGASEVLSVEPVLPNFSRCAWVFSSALEPRTGGSSGC